MLEKGVRMVSFSGDQGFMYAGKYDAVHCDTYLETHLQFSQERKRIYTDGI
jgi:hypothetical protein